MTTFRKVKLEISRANGYGQYYISAFYKNKDVKVHTTNSECFDWLNDDSNQKSTKKPKDTHITPLLTLMKICKNDYNNR